MGLWQGLALGVIVLVVGAAAYALKAIAGVATDLRAAARRPRTWVVGVPALLLVMLVGLPYVYVQATSSPAPPPLSLKDLPLDPADTAPATTVDAAASAGSVTTVAPTAPGAPVTDPADPTTVTTGSTATTAAPPTSVGSPIAGRWIVGRGSEARYNIDDTVMGNTSKVVGRTTNVTGSMQIDDRTVNAVKVVVDMRSVQCGCVHDSKYQDMMDTDQYPTSTFVLTTPIALADIPGDGVIVKVPVTGSFTIHGTTRRVTFTVSALRRSGTIAINGLIPVHLEDYGIESPNAGGLGGLSNASIELLVAFRPAA